MRPFAFLVLLSSIHTKLYAEMDLSGPERATHEYAEALSSNDKARILATVTFPETQFYRDGRTRTFMSAADYPDSISFPAQIRILETSVLDATDSIALVRVVAERIGDDGSSTTFVAWWGMRFIEDRWLVAWRQVVGPVK